MGKVNAGMVMSLDGFVKGREGNTTPLYPAFDDMMASDLMQEIIATTGAVVMGRRLFDVVDGPNGWSDSIGTEPSTTQLHPSSSSPTPSPTR